MRKRGKRLQRVCKDDSMDAAEWIEIILLLIVAVLLIAYVTKDWGLFL